MNTQLTRELARLEETVVKILLPSEVFQQYKLGKLSKTRLEPLAKTIKSLSERYLNQGNVGLSADELVAYGCYYLPINYAKVKYVIQRALNLQQNSKIRLLDFGCGPGSASLASVATLGNHQEVNLLDQSSECTKLAKSIINNLHPDALVNIVPNLEATEAQSYDLIFAANVLTESDEQSRIKITQNLLSKLMPNGHLVIIEPGTFAPTRALMELRDIILGAQGNLVVTFPCPNNTKNCPMLEQKEDWCHGQLPESAWHKTALVSQLDSLLGFNKHRIKYSSIVFQKVANISNSRLNCLIRPVATNHPALICFGSKLLSIHERKIKDYKLKRSLKSNETYISVDLKDGEF